jgi:hypothetical protein
MIRFQFVKFCVTSKTKTYKLKTYEEFFRFFQKNHDKGVIINLEEIYYV